MRLGRGRGTQSRRGSILAPLVIAFLGIALVGADASAAAAPIVPPAFRVKASNGYTVNAVAFDGTPHEEPDELILFVIRPDSYVLYLTPALVTETETATTTEVSIAADLGAIGSVDLHFVPAGRTKREHPICADESTPIDAGFYEGTISLRGEEDFMQVDATRAAGEVRLLESLSCSALTFGPGARRGELTVMRKLGTSKVELAVLKHAPRGATRYEATIEERRGPLKIGRIVHGRAPAGAFEFDAARQRARVKLPAPFSGSATFDGNASPSRRLRGNLSVDFPGNSNVPIAGPGAKARLVGGREKRAARALRLPRLAALSTFP